MRPVNNLQERTSVPSGHNEAFSRIPIGKTLEFSGWDPLKGPSVPGPLESEGVGPTGQYCQIETLNTYGILFHV